jgi:hypothetical protein
VIGDANSSAADVEFAARILIGPQLVASGEWTIGIGFHPILGAGGLKGNRALYEIQARDAARRIVVIRSGDSRQSEKKNEGDEREQVT